MSAVAQTVEGLAQFSELDHVSHFIALPKKKVYEEQPPAVDTPIRLRTAFAESLHPPPEYFIDASLMRESPESTSVNELMGRPDLHPLTFHPSAELAAKFQSCLETVLREEQIFVIRAESGETYRAASLLEMTAESVADLVRDSLLEAIAMISLRAQAVLLSEVSISSGSEFTGPIRRELAKNLPLDPYYVRELLQALHWEFVEWLGLDAVSVGWGRLRVQRGQLVMQVEADQSPFEDAIDEKVTAKLL